MTLCRIVIQIVLNNCKNNGENILKLDEKGEHFSLSNRPWS